MPAINPATDLDWFLSGGTSNTDPNLSFEGDASTTEVVDATLHNLFDKVSGIESRDGDTEYRKIWFKNSHGSLSLEGAILYVDTDSVETNVDFEVGLGSVKASGAGGSDSADESSAPSPAITFSDADGEGSGISVGGDTNIDAGEWLDVYIKRIITAGQTAKNADSAIIAVAGDSASA